MASPSTVITMGFGNGTLTGSPSLIITLGYGSGAAVIATPSLCVDMPRRTTVIDMPRRTTVVDLRRR